MEKMQAELQTKQARTPIKALEFPLTAYSKKELKAKVKEYADHGFTIQMVGKPELNKCGQIQQTARLICAKC